MRNKNFTLSEFKSDGRYEMDTTAKERKLSSHQSCDTDTYIRKNIIKNLLVSNLQ
jgi:hypothetical protein